jgi:hypothetical protein
MSTPFNYELDEARIRQLLVNASAMFSEDAWQLFDSTKGESDKNVSRVNSSNKAQNVGIGLSKNVVMSVLFVAGIGLFTLLLMNMISLKPKTEASSNERIVKPEPEKYKPAPTQPQKTLATTTSSADPKKDSVNAFTNSTLMQTTSVVVTPTSTISKETVNSNLLSSTTKTSVSADASIARTISSNNEKTQKEVDSNDNQSSIKDSTTVVKKKRKKKRQAEVLETIQTPSLLGAGDNSGEDAELK